MFPFEVSDIILREHARHMESINHEGWMFTDLEPSKLAGDHRRVRIRGRNQPVKHPALRE